MQQVAIIGGAGFIGTRLTKRLLSAGMYCRILDRKPSQSFPELSIEVDVCSIESLRRCVDAGSILINLAAEHRDDVQPRSRYDLVNVEGARNLCQVAREKGINKVVFTSSVAVYGFAPADTDEQGLINPFNDYGRTKWEAEKVLRAWQEEAPAERCLIIVRPTVVFGEGNRGNVYNLLKQIESGRFCMFGSGENCKSIAYVENVAAFLEYTLDFGPGLHLYNYVDKPDFNMNELVRLVRGTLVGKSNVGLRLPSSLGMAIGYLADAIAWMSGRPLPVSSIRVRKFLATTQFQTAVSTVGFEAPVSLESGLRRTLQYEFLEDNSGGETFETE